jgi:outer membrane protein OmpA-like peptidoglycan-associated protein
MDRNRHLSKLPSGARRKDRFKVAAVVAVVLALQAAAGVVGTNASAALTAPTFTRSTPPPTGSVCSYPSYTFTASGSGTITFTVNSGSLPTGLALSTGGVLSGTPTATGSYTFDVKAANGTSPDATTASITITISSAPTPGNNLIAASCTTVEWGQDFVGAINPPPGSVATWPNMVYNYSSWRLVDPGALGAIVSAGTINAPGAIAPSNCGAQWQWVQILCDPQAPAGPTLGSFNDLNYVYKVYTGGRDYGIDAGFTVDSVPNTEAYVVIDLGSAQAFNTLRVFQMFSDGKVTRAAIYTHPSTTNTRPAYSDGGWSLAKESPIGTGLLVTDATYKFVGCPTVMGLGAKNSRYIKLVFKNSGEFGSPTWVEVGAAKLFNETSAYVPGPGCPPEPPTGAVAAAGNAQATVTWTAGTGTTSGSSIQQSQNGGSTWTTSVTSPSPLTSSAASATVTGLTNGTPYIFRVRALSTVDNSPYTPPSNSVTPTAFVPSPPAPSGGGGGAAAPESTPTPTPAPALAPALPPLVPVVNQDNANVPAGGLNAGQSLLLMNGVPAGLVVAPNAATSPTSLMVTGNGFTMSLAGLNAQGRPLGLSSDGGALVLEQDQVAQVEGTGFLPNSEVRLYVFSEPRYIGSVTTDASGSFSGQVPIPTDLAVGAHTLQANGYSKDDKVRSLSLGVIVRPDRAPRIRAAGATVTFQPLSSQLSPEAKAQLRALLKGRKATAVRTRVMGFVQPTMFTSNDQSLSMARANSVKAYLRSLGLKGPLTARGDGIAPETGAAGRKVNVSIRYAK